MSPFTEVRDNSTSYGKGKYITEFEEPLGFAYSNNEKEKLIMTITSNDTIMNLPALEDAFRHTFYQFTVEPLWVNGMIESIIEFVKKNELCTTNRWEFSIPITGPDYDLLTIQVYPTFKSWEHLRRRKNKYCPHCIKHNCIFELEKDDNGKFCSHCSYDAREYKCTLADFLSFSDC
jgi:hypothetical protein